jgi:hypothetical protein
MRSLCKYVASRLRPAIRDGITTTLDAEEICRVRAVLGSLWFREVHWNGFKCRSSAEGEKFAGTDR